MCALSRCCCTDGMLFVSSLNLRLLYSNRMIPFPAKRESSYPYHLQYKGTTGNHSKAYFSNSHGISGLTFAILNLQTEGKMSTKSIAVGVNGLFLTRQHPQKAADETSFVIRMPQTKLKNIDLKSSRLEAAWFALGDTLEKSGERIEEDMYYLHEDVSLESKKLTPEDFRKYALVLDSPTPISKNSEDDQTSQHWNGSLFSSNNALKYVFYISLAIGVTLFTVLCIG